MSFRYAFLSLILFWESLHLYWEFWYIFSKKKECHANDIKIVLVLHHCVTLTEILIVEDFSETSISVYQYGNQTDLRNCFKILFVYRYTIPGHLGYILLQFLLLHGCYTDHLHEYYTNVQ